MEKNDKTIPQTANIIHLFGDVGKQYIHLILVNLYNILGMQSFLFWFTSFRDIFHFASRKGILF